MNQRVLDHVTQVVIAGPRRSGRGRALAALVLIAVELAVWCLVYLTGGTEYVYLHAMYLPVSAAGVLLGGWGGAAAGLLGGVLLGPLMPLDVATGTPQPLSAVLYRTFFFVLDGLVVSSFAAALHWRLNQNEALRERLSATYGRNLRLFASLVAERDELTSGHCERVAQNAVVLGTRLRLPEHEIRLLYWAGLLHDLGKVGVPEAILQKPGKLTQEEYAVMKRHARLGRDILMGIAEEFAPIADGVWSHHEHWSGGGYPRGLQGKAIPLFGRILAVADVFEALTCDRPYRAAMPPERALAIVEEGVGSQFDPDVAAVFFEAYRAGDITLQAEPEVLFDSFVTSVLDERNDVSQLFAEAIASATG